MPEQAASAAERGADGARLRRAGGRDAVNDARRALILEAALAVFEAEGLEGASMRAIADRAGYTAAALYFHFASKEAVYAAVLEASLDRLIAAVTDAVAPLRAPSRRMVAAALAFYDFYAANPRDLDLGFYLFRGGMRRRGLSRELDGRLNARLLEALSPIAAAAREAGAGEADAKAATASLFAHASGLLLLAHTGRLELFGAGLFGGDARRDMQRYVEQMAGTIGARPRPRRAGKRPRAQVAPRKEDRS